MLKEGSADRLMESKVLAEKIWDCVKVGHRHGLDKLNVLKWMTHPLTWQILKCIEESKKQGVNTANLVGFTMSCDGESASSFTMADPPLDIAERQVH